MNENERIYLFDTTLRDGVQGQESIGFDSRKRIFDAISNSGVDIIEAGFPVAKEEDYDIIRYATHNAISGQYIAGLTRAILNDIDKTWEALSEGSNICIHTFIGTSPMHRKHKHNMTQDEIDETVIRAVSHSRNLVDKFSSNGYVQFSLEDFTRTEFDYSERVIRSAIINGAKVINLPDTVGYAMPEDIRKRFAFVRDIIKDYSDVRLSCHNHNDLENAVSNSLSALRNGARQIETTFCGVGERTGNANLVSILAGIETRPDKFPFDFRYDISKSFDVSNIVADEFGILIGPNTPVIGADAFKHGAGIHQHGILSDKSTYEVLKPENWGVNPERFMFNASSGISLVDFYLRQKEIIVNDRTILRDVCERAKNLAITNGKVSAEEMVSIYEIVLASTN